MKLGATFVGFKELKQALKQSLKKEKATVKINKVKGGILEGR